MTLLPKFEPLEDRIVLDGVPSVTIAGPDGTAADQDIFLGAQDVPFTLTFDNTHPTDAGYAPYIDLILPSTGADGDDGVSFDSASFLGAPITTTEITFDAMGNATHPLAVDAGNNPLIVNGTPGDTLVVLELPYGSFSAGNPAVNVDVLLDFSDFADLDVDPVITASGGFALGATQQDDPATDPSIVGATASLTTHPILVELEKESDAPEAEPATGPSYIYHHTITLDVADGQTLTDYTLTDTLPDAMVYMGNLNAAGGTVTIEPTIGTIAGAGNNLIEIEYATLAGERTVTFDYYLAEDRAGPPAATLLDPNTGARVQIDNVVDGAGTWDPLDPRDPVQLTAQTDTNTTEASAIAIQKSVALAVDNDIVGTTGPGDILEYTIDIQVSDFFTMGAINVTDVLGNGLAFVGGSATLTTQEDKAEGIALPVALTTTTGPGPGAGETRLQWDVSAAMDAVAGNDAYLAGDATDGDTDLVQARARIQYRAEILADYSGGAGIGDTPVGQGDILVNDVRVDAEVRDNSAPAIKRGDVADTSSAEIELPFGMMSAKTVYAINGSTAVVGDEHLAAGDTVTFAVTYEAPLGAFENLQLLDYLPLNVFDVEELANFAAISGAAPPPAGTIQYGPNDDYLAEGGADPAISYDAGNEGLILNFGDFTYFDGAAAPNRASATVEILFTLTVQDAIFAPELLLTNQVTSVETNTFGATESSTAIAEFNYGEPVLSVTKGIVATDSTDPAVAFSATAAPVAFNAPGTPGARFSGTISSDRLAATPIDANLSGIDAGDLVTFAVVLENTGRGQNGAFNITLVDTLPAGFEIPTTAEGLNLRVTDGTGARTIALEGGAPADLFTTGIEFRDRTAGAGPDEGALSAYDPASGENVLILTYDLVAAQSVTANETIANTATLTNYTAYDSGGIDRTPTDLSDAAQATTRDVDVTKTLTGREFGEGDPDQVMVGEEFTFTVRYDIPEGTYQNVSLSDTVRSDGAYGAYEILSARITNFDAGVLSSSSGMALNSAGTVAGDGNSVNFALGTLTNTENGIAADDIVEIEVVARSVASDGETAGTALGNTARFAATGVDVSATAEVELIEPDLAITKTPDIVIVEGEDRITYSIELENRAGPTAAPAYDLVITDTLADPYLMLDAGTVTVKIDGVAQPPGVVTTGNGGADTTVRVDIPELAVGQTVTVEFEAEVDALVPNGRRLTNTADATFDSLQTDGDDGERDYTLSGATYVTTREPEVTKVVVDTSFDETSGLEVAIGEIVTYEIMFVIPKGTDNDTVLYDAVPQIPGTMEYISSEVLRIGRADGSGDIAGSNLAVGDSGTYNPVTKMLSFDFGDLRNTGDKAIGEGDQIVVEVVARVTDIPSNASNSALPNTARLEFENGVREATANLTVVEPSLDIDKSVAPTTADAGDTVTYSIASTNIGGGPAYDIIIDDDLSDPALRLPGAPAATIRVLDGGVDVTPGGANAPSVTFPTASDGLSATIPVLLPGQTIEITYQMEVEEGAGFDARIENTAIVTRYDTDEDGDGADPDDGRVYDAGLAGYTPPEDTAVVTTDSSSITKAVVSTTDALTSGTDVAIGETVTYRVEIDLAEGTETLVVQDEFLAGMKPISAAITAMPAGLGGNLTQGDTDSSSAFIGLGFGGDGYVFDFGSIYNPGDNDPSNDKIVLTIVGRTVDDAAFGDGDDLTNAARLLKDVPGTGLVTLDTDSADVTLREPDLDIDKTASPTTGDAGDTITYTVVSTNSGAAPAYDVEIEDDFSAIALQGSNPATASVRILNAANADVTPAGANAPTITYPDGGSEISVTVPVLAPGQRIELVYDAILTDGALIASAVDNTATVTRYDTNAQDAGTPADEVRVYDAALVGHTPPADDARVETDAPDIVKTVAASSDTGTTGANVSVGELVTYELTIDVPEGTVDLFVDDELPAGLDPVSARVKTMSAAMTADIAQGDSDTSSASIFTAFGGTGFTFDFGTLVNPGDNDAGNDTIVLAVVGRVTDSAATSAGSVLTNEATVRIDDPVGGMTEIDSDTADVTVREPELDIVKTASPATADAGDVVTYTVISQNTGDAAAYDAIIDDDFTGVALRGTSPAVASVRILDAADVDITPAGANAPVITYADGGTGISVSVPVLQPGTRIELVYDAVVTEGAKFSSTVVNTATVTRYDTNPDDGPTPPDEVRVFDASLPGYTPPSDKADIATPDIAIGKTLSDSSDPNTPLAAGVFNIGEIATFRIDVTVPEGTGDLTIVDQMPAGLVVTGGSVVSMGGNVGQTITSDNLSVGDDAAAPAITIGAGGENITFDFGTVTAFGDNDNAAADAQISVLVAARVDNLAAISNGVNLTDTATATITDPDAPPIRLQPDVSDTETISVVEPTLEIEKSGPIAVNPGDVVTYSVTFRNTGTGPAYDIALNDDMANAFLSYIDGTLTVSRNGTDITAGLTVTPLGDGFSTLIDELQAGEAVDVTYQALLDASAPEARTYPNIAEITFDTVKDGDPETPTARPGTISDEYGVATVPHIVKTAIETGNPDTGTGRHDPGNFDLTVGETVTYRLDMYLPEVSMTSVVARDTLPEGLAFVSARLLSVGAGIVGADAPAISHAGQVTTFDFGAVTNPLDRSIGDDDIIRLELVARVVEADAISDGAVLTNTSTLDVTAQGNAVLNTAVSTEDIDIVLPDLVIDKTGPEGVDPGDVIDYRLEVSNAGTAAAYDVQIADAMAGPDLSYVSGSTSVLLNGVAIAPPVNEGADGFDLIIPVLGTDDTLVVTYQGLLSPTALPLESYENTATATYDTVPDGNPNSPDGRSEQTDDSHLVGAGPTLEKTVVASAFAATDAAMHDTALEDLVVGETVTYRLTITLPEIAMDEVRLTDVLPDGLEYVSATVADTGGVTVNGATSITHSGQTTTFVLNDLVNAYDGSIGADDQIAVELTARVRDVAGNVDGATLLNTADVTITPLGGTRGEPYVTQAEVEIVEPALTIDKSGDVAVNPGDLVSYTLRMQNTGTGPAYDLLVTDPMGSPYLTYMPGTLIASVDGSDITSSLAVTPDGAGFRLIVPELDTGQTLTIDYSALLSPSAPDANSFENNATVTFDTVPDGTPDSGTGRQDSVSDDFRVATVPHIDKDTVSSSLTETGAAQGDPELDDLNIGEEVDYIYTIYLPEIDMDSVVVTDTLDAGLELISWEMVSIGDGLTVEHDTPIRTDIAAGTFTLDFGAVENPLDGSIGLDDTLVVRLTARVDNAAGVTDGVVLTNRVDLEVLPAGGTQFATVTAEADVEVVEPNLSIDKTGPRGANPGETIGYGLEIRNEGRGPAFDVVISDSFADPALSLVPGSMSATLDGDPITPAITSTSNGFSFTLPLIDAGAVVTVAYEASISDDASPALTLSNTARATFDSTPGDDPADDSRDGSTSASHDTVLPPDLIKTIARSDIPETGHAQHDPSIADVTIGERVTYNLRIVLPETSLTDVLLRDTLPEGLEFVSARVAFVGDGLAGAEDTTITASGQSITVDFGAITNPFDGSIGADDVIDVEIVARVGDSAFDGDRLTNDARLSVLLDDRPILEDQFGEASVEVVEPDVSIAKSVSDPRPKLGDTITYTVTMTNAQSATGPAFNLTMTDQMPFGLLLLGEGRLSDPEAGTTSVEIIDGVQVLTAEVGQLLPGESVVLVYDVLVGFLSPVLEDIDNLASLSYATTPDPDNPGRPIIIVDDARTVPDPIPLEDERRVRPAHLGIDDADFRPLLSIEPIFAGSAEPNSNVTLTLYRQDGTPTHARHVLADAGGHWIAGLPQVSLAPVEDDFGELYRRSSVFDAPVRHLDAVPRDMIGRPLEARTLSVGAQIADEAYTIGLEARRPTLLPEALGTYNERLSYAPAENQAVFSHAEILRVDEVFEDLAGITVERLCNSSANPLGPGLNRFNYEFLAGATAHPGSAR